MDADRRIVEGDLSIRDGRIDAVGGDAGAGAPHDRILDARGGYVLPGLVQTHLHLCQTLFRGSADDLPLLDWLRRRIWPLEAAHTRATLRASARLATTELLMSGTTTILTMETVHETDVVFEAVQESGLRATIGKCMMDRESDAPRRLKESTRAALDESLGLHRRWHGAAGGRLRAALAPRFALSCTRDLLEGVAAVARDGTMLVHTHASESRDEVAAVRQAAAGASPIEYLADAGLASAALCAAHCVWIGDRDMDLLAGAGVRVLHCPGSNLKLGSGVAPVAEMRARGITVSLGADGAACNNRLDMFEEMRLAAVLQAVRSGPGALSAADALWMATMGGARTLGLEREIGSLEPGKRADVIVVARDRPHMAPAQDPYSTLVYAARGADVAAAVVDGDLLLENGRPVRVDVAEVVAEARSARKELEARAWS
jgi:5-methylthioadenosine/S-adenosylhomocysteine deaminase